MVWRLFFCSAHHHPRCCNRLRNRYNIRSHNEVLRAVVDGCRSLGCSALLEPAVGAYGHRERADALITPPGAFAPIAIDVTIRQPAPSQVRRPRPNPLAAANDAEAEKNAKYAKPCKDQLGAKFLPFVLESKGGLGNSARSFARDIALSAQLYLGAPKVLALSLIQGVAAIALARAHFRFFREWFYASSPVANAAEAGVIAADIFGNNAVHHHQPPQRRQRQRAAAANRAGRRRST